MSTETDAVVIRKTRTISVAENVPEAVEVIADLEGVGKFEERKHLQTDNGFEYPRDGSDPGLVLIFNQDNIPGENERLGTRRDVNEIIQCFQRQGYNIDKDNIMNEGTTEQIKTKLKQVSEMDWQEKNCLIIFFLTHGQERDRLLTIDGSISTNEIWNYFTQCKGLENKPKMFVFQACKGGSFSTTVKTLISESSRIVHDDTFLPTFMGPDMLVVYSTIEGNVSFRSTLTGSWFIQELCKNITAYGKRDDVFSLITRTAKCVSGNYFHYKSGVNMKQMPVCMSTLSKKFYLNRNKDRAIVLKCTNYYQDILDQVDQIKKQVDSLK